MLDDARGNGGLKGSLVVYARLRPAERRALDIMAQNEHRSISNMIRLAILEAAGRRGLVLDADPDDLTDAEDRDDVQG